MLIGLNKDFDVPKGYSVRCNAPPSMFAYPKMDEKKEDKKELVATAVLSTTARAKAREARKEAKKSGSTKSQDGLSDGPALDRVTSDMSTASLIIEELGDKQEEPKKKEKEATWFILENPSRVTPAQVRFVSEEQQRYGQVGKKTGGLSGIVVLVDNDPTAPDEVDKIERVEPGQEEEASPPEPFDWDPSQE